jgi:hypothetical protein
VRHTEWPRAGAQADLPHLGDQVGLDPVLARPGGVAAVHVDLGREGQADAAEGDVVHAPGQPFQQTLAERAGAFGDAAAGRQIAERGDHRGPRIGRVAFVEVDLEGR